MGKICNIKHCQRIVSRRKNICNTCYSRQWRKQNPAKAAYRTLKGNAKRRKIPFELTFAEFKNFAQHTNYLMGKGRSKDSLTIDRIDQQKGYTKDNIQVLSNSENVKKYLEYYCDERGVPIVFRFKKLELPDTSDSPF